MIGWSGSGVADHSVSHITQTGVLPPARQGPVQDQIVRARRCSVGPLGGRYHTQVQDSVESDEAVMGHRFSSSFEFSRLVLGHLVLFESFEHSISTKRPHNLSKPSFYPLGGYPHGGTLLDGALLERPEGGANNAEDGPAVLEEQHSSKVNSWRVLFLEGTLEDCALSEDTFRKCIPLECTLLEGTLLEGILLECILGIPRISSWRVSSWRVSSWWVSSWRVHSWRVSS